MLLGFPASRAPWLLGSYAPKPPGALRSIGALGATLLGVNVLRGYYLLLLSVTVTIAMLLSFLLVIKAPML